MIFHSLILRANVVGGDKMRKITNLQSILHISTKCCPGQPADRMMRNQVEVQILIQVQGVFFNWYPPKKLKYGKPKLGVSTLT